MSSFTHLCSLTSFSNMKSPTKIDYILTPWELAHTMDPAPFFLMAFVKNFIECHWVFFFFSVFLKSICFILAFSFLLFFFLSIGFLTTVDPWTTQIWIVWVHLNLDLFFFSNKHYTNTWPMLIDIIDKEPHIRTNLKYEGLTACYLWILNSADGQCYYSPSCSRVNCMFIII